MKISKFLLYIFTISIITLFTESIVFSQALPNFGGDKPSKKIAEKSDDAGYPDINDFVPVDQQPALVKRSPVTYPELAKTARIEGNVYLKVLIDKDGKAKKAVVFKSDADVFNDAAIQSALKSSYTSATNDGRTVATWMVVPYSFKL
jgi:TonB family protein